MPMRNAAYLSCTTLVILARDPSSLAAIFLDALAVSALLVIASAAPSRDGSLSGNET